MNSKEIFYRTTHFEEVDRVPNVEIGCFSETMERWYKEGLPRTVLPVWERGVPIVILLRDSLNTGMVHSSADFGKLMPE